LTESTGVLETELHTIVELFTGFENLRFFEMRAFDTATIFCLDGFVVGFDYDKRFISICDDDITNFKRAYPLTTFR
jgi:hypothetical protein